MLKRRDVELELEKIESRLNGIRALAKSGWTPDGRKNAINHVSGVVDAMKIVSIRVMRHYQEVMSPDRLMGDLARYKIIPDFQGAEGDRILAEVPRMARMSEPEFAEFMGKVSELFANYLRYMKKYLKDLGV